MTDTSHEFSRLPSALMLQIDRLCSRLEASWQAGIGLNAEELLPELQNLSAEQQQAALAELLPLELEYRRRYGRPAGFAELTARFPSSDPAWLQQVLGWAEPETILGPAVSDSDGFAMATGSSPSVTSVSPVPERLGDYRLLRILGQGGMGTVYEAVHERMGRAVAVKVLRAEIRGNAALLQRFEREVRTAAKLIHPHIVTALDARIHEGLPFLVTELVDGEDLETLVRRDGPLAVDTALDVIAQVATGLAYAHEQGVVHRDIKPANLLRDRRGVVRILDMGLARLDEMQRHGSTAGTEVPAGDGLTDSGLIMGTAAYMAPEQARDTRRADARSDLYSLGCTLHFLLTGRPPYTAASAIDMIVAHLQRPLPQLKDGVADRRIPDSVQQLFEQLVAKNAEDRIQTAAATADRITALRKTPEHSELRPHDVHPMSQRPAKRGRMPGAGVLLIVSVLAIVVCIVFLRRAQEAPDPAAPVASSLPEAEKMVTAEPPTITFDGIAGYLQMPALTPEAGTAYTLEAIVRPQRFQTCNLLSWLGPDWMALYVSDSGQPGTARLFAGQSTVLIGQGTLQADRWTHVAAVFESGRARMFVNGQEESLTPINFTLSETTGGLFAGGVDPGCLPEGENRRFFCGSMRGLRISRGARYGGAFEAPLTLLEDSQTIAVMRPNADGTALVFRDGAGRELKVVPSAAGVE
ncbi:MAG: protein kinase domain-containing protein [Planctomycetota bacterium]